MVFVILSIAVLNLGLGYVLGVWWYGSTTAHSPSIDDEPSGCKAPYEIAPPGIEADPSPAIPVVDPPADIVADFSAEAVVRHTPEIPQECSDLLDETIDSNNFVEASVHVLKLEVGRYRDQLIHVDGQVRQCRLSHEPERIVQCLATLKSANQEWLQRQAQACNHLHARKGNLTDFVELGASLEHVLMEQAAQIETTCSNIDLLDFRSDLSAGCWRLLQEIARLLDLCHGLRDRMQDSLLSIVKHEGRLATISKELQTDSLTSLVSRPGLEHVLQTWWRDDPGRKRPLSIVLGDIDGLAKVNEQQGPLCGDRLIRAMGELFGDSLRKNRGFDVSARFAGQQFVALLGDTTQRDATNAAERIRQRVVAATFEHDGARIECGLSCGVVEARYDDSSATLFKRAQQAVRQAKWAGHNQTWVYEGAEPVHVSPLPYNVAARTVVLDDVELCAVGATHS